MKNEKHVLRIADLPSLELTKTLGSFKLRGVEKAFIDDIPFKDLLESHRILKRLLKMGMVASGVMDPTETSEPASTSKDKDDPADENTLIEIFKELCGMNIRLEQLLELQLAIHEMRVDACRETEERVVNLGEALKEGGKTKAEIQEAEKNSLR